MVDPVCERAARPRMIPVPGNPSLYRTRVTTTPADHRHHQRLEPSGAGTADPIDLATLGRLGGDSGHGSLPGRWESRREVAVGAEPDGRATPQSKSVRDGAGAFVSNPPSPTPPG